MVNVQLRRALGFPDLLLFYLVTSLSLRWNWTFELNVGLVSGHLDL